MFTHRDVCATVIEGGGDYVLPVKDNQPTLARDIAAAFAGPEAGLSPPPGGAARGRDRAGVRGRQGARPDREAVDRDHLVARRVPGLGLARLRQVYRLTRERRIGEEVEIEVVLGITSLPRERAGAKELLGLTRGHWGIENGLHGVRDGTLREDASRIRKGSATQVMAVVRNIVVFLFHRLGHKSAAAATRHYVCHPEKSLEILSTPI